MNTILEKMSDAQLYEYFENSMDDAEEFSAMIEMAYRKHSKISEICLSIINARMPFEKNEHSLGNTKDALTCLYIYDDKSAINFVKSHYKELPLDAFGNFINDYTDKYYKSENIDNDLIILIKDYLKILKKEEIAEIQFDYDAFMKVYKNV